MCDFLGEDAQEVQDARQGCLVYTEGGDNESQHVLPLGHLDGQIRQANAQLQSKRLRSGMEGGQVPHK
jgi:hypothetical protein